MVIGMARLKPEDEYKQELYRKEYLRNPQFEKDERFFNKLNFWWTVFSVAAAVIMIVCLFASGNAAVILMLFSAMIPITVAFCMSFVKSGIRGIMFISIMGGMVALFVALLLLRNPNFSSGTIWAQCFVLVLLAAAAVQIALSVFVFVSRKIGDYVSVRRRIENQLKGNF